MANDLHKRDRNSSMLNGEIPFPKTPKPFRILVKNLLAFSGLHDLDRVV